MKKIIPISVLAIFFASLSFLNFSEDAEAQALKKATSFFHNGMDELAAAIEEYQAVAELLEDDDASIQELRDVHLNTRLTYKKIEAFLEYFDPLAIKQFINGAPLPQLEPKAPEVVVLEPVGLQVLDELAFAESPYEEKEEIVRLVQTLDKDFNKVHRHQRTIKLTHRHVFEANRAEIIRIFTLGVTGFDTPGSVNALPEAKVAFDALFKTFLPYLPLIKEKNLAQAFNLSGHLDIATQFMDKNQDFDSFDRMQFLRKVIDPLYQMIYDAHVTLGIETKAEVSKLPIAVNFEATSIFSDDFFNKDYYSNLNLTDKEFEERAALGKLLFFDPVLSENNERSCASCHQADKAFTDGQPTSYAYDGQSRIQRNAPTIINALYSPKYFYDLRETDLEKQVKHVMQDTSEFHTDYTTIVKKLKESKEYTKLFKEAYKSQAKYSLSIWSVTNALATYVASLTSFNSEVDKYIRNEISHLDAGAIRGFNLFMGKAACGTCHFAPSFNGTVPPSYADAESEILGVPEANVEVDAKLDADLGRVGNGKLQEESLIYKHSFKTVTVRNAALTAPYMHNGVYKTLDEVVDFYNKGGGEGLGYEVPYQTLPFSSLDLNENEMADLVTFMESLTDTTGMTQLPTILPKFEDKPEWNTRKVGGTY